MDFVLVQNSLAMNHITYLFFRLTIVGALRWQEVAYVAIIFSFFTKSHSSPDSGISSMNKHHHLEIKQEKVCLP